MVCFAAFVDICAVYYNIGKTDMVYQQSAFVDFVGYSEDLLAYEAARSVVEVVDQEFGVVRLG